MKLIQKGDRQYDNWWISCSPVVMQDCLNILNELFRSSASNAKEVEYGACHMFTSGAKLYWTGRSSYVITPYSSDASDAQRAWEELQIAYQLRAARKTFNGRFKDDTYEGYHRVLKFEVDWG